MARWPASILKLLLGLIIVVTLLSSCKDIPPSFNFRSINASRAEVSADRTSPIPKFSSSEKRPTRIQALVYLK